uniref:C2H2-type domain-containing protein n=1 Tax=Globodera rostochiensis TaxID=31243 RepID=A0A914I7D7_GLORO
MAKQQIISTGGRETSTLTTDNRTNIRQNSNRHKEKLAAGSKPSVGKQYKCADCPKTFAFPSKLAQHKRYHTGERPFKCQQCKKRFHISGNLKGHLRIHSGERPFKCADCAKRFNQSNNLKKHSRIHSDERLFKCVHCDKAFNRHETLKDHSCRIHSKDEELPREKYIKVVIVRHVPVAIVRHVKMVRRETMFVHFR